jgi:integrase
MARHYYLTRSGRLRRKNNTLLFEIAGETEKEKLSAVGTDEPMIDEELAEEVLSNIGQNLGADSLGEFLLEERAEDLIKAFKAESEAEKENDAPVRVQEKRVIPVEDVDALWSFRELDLNARVLSFLAQHKIPLHFFNYYGFYTGSFYPREYLQAGFLLVKQVRHYSSPEEYLGLKWKDIDWQNGAAIVQRALVWKRKGGGWSLQEPKTSQSRRTIPLPKSVLSELHAYRKKQLEERLKLGQAYENNDFVFATELGSPILTSNLTRRHFKPILKKAELSENIRLYDLRHTCATLLLSAGKNPKVIAERLGHSTVVLTLDTYSHVLPSMQKDATDELEQMLFRKTGTQ